MRKSCSSMAYKYVFCPAQRVHADSVTQILSKCRLSPLSGHRLRFYSTSNPNSSIDPTEISHFDALASTWWDPHGSSRLLHLMNPLRHDFIHQCHSSQPRPPPSSLR